MTKRRFLLDVRPRDADAPSYHDLRLDADRLLHEFRGEPCFSRMPFFRFDRQQGSIRTGGLDAVCRLLSFAVLSRF